MKQTRILMDMPVTVEIYNAPHQIEPIEEVFAYFAYIDATFSTFKKDSEISRFNAGLISNENLSFDMKTILRLAENTKKETDGYFDIEYKGKRDPSGIVKGWAITKAAELLKKKGMSDFYVDAGGDIEVSGHNAKGHPWQIGIRNPFNHEEIVKVIQLTRGGVATSGSAIRGQHIYNPKENDLENTQKIVSITVVGSSAYEADRFATAAFAMGNRGIEFIENKTGLEGYQIDESGHALMTSGFETYL